LFTVQLTVMLVCVTVATGLPVMASAGCTVSVATPYFVGSSVLVAFTVIDVPVAGAVTTPAGVMVPPVADHVTPELKLLVPVTVEAQVVVPLATTVVAWQTTDTPVIVGSGVMLTTAEADLAVFCTLVAVTVTAEPVVGAVRTPFDVMLPLEADHVTALEKLPVPVTGAVQATVLPARTLPVPQDTEMLEIVAEGVTGRTTEDDLVESCTLVAVTVTEVPLLGAVSTPAGVIEPAEADHVTADE